MNMQTAEKTSKNQTKVTLADLYNYPTFSHPRFSPCGSYFTYLAPAPIAGAPTIWLAETKNKLPHDTPTTIKGARPLIINRTRPLTNYTWMHTGNHLLFIQDTDGNEKGHLYVHDIAAGTTTAITFLPQERVLPSYFIKKESPTTVIFQNNKRDEAVYDVIAYDVVTGAYTTIEQNPGNVISWYIDNNLHVRACATFTEQNTITLHLRATINDRWKAHVTWQSEDTYTSHGLFFSPDNRIFYYADTANTNTNLVQSVVLETGVVTPLWSDPKYDMYHEATLTDLLERTPPHSSTIWGAHNTIAAFSYQRERLTWHFVTNEIADRHPALFRLLTDSNYETWIEQETARSFIVGQCNTTTPPHFYHYIKDTQAVSFLGSTREGLAQKLESMPTLPVHTVTADGLTVNGYLTLPAIGIAPYPLVLKIHGGPWTRDVFMYSPDIQMLTNNGYACLQVNYRGSTGYGKKFACAGIKELGGTMIDDVIALMQDVVKHYPLDGHRIAYMGRSYGGFSALSAGWRYQHLFKAIIAQVPPTDLTLLMESYPKHWSLFKYHFQRRMGNTEHEAEMLRAQSPATHGHTAQLPTLISYAIHDARVVPEHADRYINVMIKSPHNKVICFENEGHFNLLQESLLRHWGTVLEFLNTHLA